MPDLAERLRTAFELHDAGVALMRENLRRRHPEESAERIEARLASWLADRPGAPDGDAVGRRREWRR